MGGYGNQPWWHSVETQHKSDKTLHVKTVPLLDPSCLRTVCTFSMISCCCAQLFVQWALILDMTPTPTMQCDGERQCICSPSGV